MSEEKTKPNKIKKLKMVNPEFKVTSIVLTLISFIIFLAFIVFAGGEPIFQIVGAAVAIGFYHLSLRGIAKYNKIEPYIYLELTEEEYKKRTKGRPIMMVGYIIVGVIFVFVLLGVLSSIFQW